MQLSAKRIKSIGNSQEGKRYEITIPQFVTSIDDSQVEIKPRFVYVTKEDLLTQLTIIQQRIALCEAADLVVIEPISNTTSDGTIEDIE